MIVSAGAMAAFPMATNAPEALAVLAVKALGDTALGSSPSAYTANLAGADQRTQALALLRTFGDVGMLVGGSGVGAVAAIYGSDLAMQGTAAFLASNALLFSFRHYVFTQDAPAKSPKIEAESPGKKP